jgi:CheY-like chemotaxis protein
MWRPIAYVAVDDATCRARVTDTLQRLGWTVIEQPSGFHVLAAIADVVERAGEAAQPGLLVVDEISRGCSGATLARGLRDLGRMIPVVLVRHPWAPHARSTYGVGIHVVDSALAASTVAELVRPWSPVSLMQSPSTQHARATA